MLRFPKTSESDCLNMLKHSPLLGPLTLAKWTERVSEEPQECDSVPGHQARGLSQANLDQMI